jgi:hypothetical protein
LVGASAGFNVAGFGSVATETFSVVAELGSIADAADKRLITSAGVTLLEPCALTFRSIRFFLRCAALAMRVLLPTRIK